MLTQSAQQDLDAKMTRAVQLQTSGEIDQAIDIYNIVLAEYPQFSAALHNLGVIALQRLDLENAVRLIDVAQQLAPREAEILRSVRSLGLTLHQHGFWEQAREWLLQVIANNPEDDEVRSVLERSSPRNYLAPERYCNSQEKILTRYSPREASSYVYVIDIVGTCNLRCPTCPVGNFDDAVRPKGFMPLPMFKQIIEKIKTEEETPESELFLFNWGEPLLHPELAEFIEVAHQAGLKVTLSTNLNIKTDMAAMVKSNPESIKISLSGFTQETYSLTHARGKIDLFKANLFRLKSLIDSYESTSRVYIGHHIYQHNVDQLQEVSSLCAELGFEHAPIQAFFQPLEKLKQVIDGELDSNDLPVIDLLQLHPRDRFERLKASRKHSYDCELRFNQTVINHDGSVALCCGVYDQQNMLGVNFLDASHEELEDRKYKHPFCKTCKQYEMDYTPNVLPR